MPSVTPAPDSPFPRVSLYYWRPKNGSINFGDQLSEIVVEKVLSSRDRTLDEETSRFSRLLAIGSILHFAQDRDIIWGSGVNGKIPESRFVAQSLDIRAVRGPLTADFLRRRGFHVPEIYGDPALLLSRLFGSRFEWHEADDYVFVPNLHDLPLVAGEPNVVSPLEGWNRVTAKIVRAKLVLASSLHGLVVADSFGVPARYVRLSETEGFFKYEDYALGTGRPNLTFARSIAEGREMGGMMPPRCDLSALLDAFPWDLWDVQDR
jgi:pyruvyltransferase